MAGKRLGQNFLFDPSILLRIITAADLQPDDTVVEIGPGPGSLTRLLADHVRRVIAIELDGHLFESLKTKLRHLDSVELVHGDALKYPYENIGRFKVVSNIPYYITTPVIFRLLDARENLETMTLTIQREVAERIVALPGGKEYGVLSIMVQYYAEATLKFLIGKEAFRPVPKVDSAVIHLKMRTRPAVTVSDEDLLFRVIRTAFAQRRKTLSNSLKPISPDIREVLVRTGIDPRRRPETLSISEFAKLADNLNLR